MILYLRCILYANKHLDVLFNAHNVLFLENLHQVRLSSKKGKPFRRGESIGLKPLLVLKQNVYI